MAVLLVEPAVRRLVRVHKLPFVLGRSNASNYQIRSAWVSRTHCFFAGRDEEITVCDLGSSNGTILNGKPLEPGVPVPVGDGDRLQIGPVELIVRIDEGVELEHLLSGRPEPQADPNIETDVPEWEQSPMRSPARN